MGGKALLSQKKMISRAFFVLLCFFCGIAPFSCKSLDSVVIVPNEGNVMMDNIATEYCTLAESFMTSKKYDSAVEYYKKTESIRGESALLSYKIARAYAMNNKFSAAEPIFEELYQKDSRNTNIMLCLAYVYIKNEKPNKALPLYSKLYNSNPYDAQVLTNYALVLIGQNDLINAERMLNELKAVQPESAEIGKIEKLLKKSEPSDSADSEE
ncbi:MAG: hypothetical protein MJ183_00610 [Treponemataceae bacterium]|nr:hypothetical protein [Treponemataceae bacterium]